MIAGGSARLANWLKAGLKSMREHAKACPEGVQGGMRAVLAASSGKRECGTRVWLGVSGKKKPGGLARALVGGVKGLHATASGFAGRDAKVESIAGLILGGVKLGKFVGC